MEPISPVRNRSSWEGTLHVLPLPSMLTPRSMTKSMRRNKRECFQIHFGGSDTSESSSGDLEVDDVFCSSEESGALDQCVESQETLGWWGLAGFVLFLIPVLVMSALSNRGYSPDASVTIQNKTQIPQNSLTKKIYGTSSAPSRSPPLSLLTFSPTQPKDTSGPHLTQISSVDPETSLQTPEAQHPHDTDTTIPAPTPIPTPSIITGFPTFPPTKRPFQPPSQLATNEEQPPFLSFPSIDVISVAIAAPSAIPVAAPSPTQQPTFFPTATSDRIHPPVSWSIHVPTSPPVRTGTSILLNCGGNQLVESTPIGQRFWIPDRFYATSGNVWRNATCDDDEDDDVFCTGREGVESYTIPVTNGVYALTLHVLLLGNRPCVFDVLGKRVVATHNRQQVVLKTRVENGKLQVTFTNIIPAAPVTLAAVELGPLSSTTTLYAPPNATYVPGDLQVHRRGLVLSRGLRVRTLASTGQRVLFGNRTKSTLRFHGQPDAGATYPDRRPGNEGGWIYVSNSEMKPERSDPYPGGVGALTFDRDGEVIDYQMLLKGTRMNCGGGRTPWESWISGEEYADTGRIWQVDPTGQRTAERITMGEEHPGLFESFAYDTRDRGNPYFFMTKDHESGALRRFLPDVLDWDDPWRMLTQNGTLDYLVINPFNVGSNAGHFYWTSDYDEGAAAAIVHYQNSEGIDVNGHHLYFVSKAFRTIFILDLDAGTYVNETTRNGLFNGQPDQIERVDEGRPAYDDELVYFTEDGGKLTGVHARNRKGQYLTILESSSYSDETTGLSFSPDGLHMYMAYQDNGILFDVTREDGLPFQADILDIKFHDAK